MWTEVKNQSKSLFRNGNTSERAVPVDPLVLLSTVEQNNGTTAVTHPSHTENPFARGSGIIPGAIAAAVFIGFLLALYAVLWKCMVSPPLRKRRRLKVREQRC